QQRVFAGQDGRQDETDQHHHGEAQADQREQPLPAPQQQHRGGEDQSEHQQRSAALEIDHLVGGGVFGGGAGIAEDDLVSHGELRGGRVRGQHLLDGVPGAGPVLHSQGQPQAFPGALRAAGAGGGSGGDDFRVHRVLSEAQVGPAARVVTERVQQDHADDGGEGERDQRDGHGSPHRRGRGFGGSVPVAVPVPVSDVRRSVAALRLLAGSG